MKKHILIFGAGKSATSLIDYLKKQLQANSWMLTVADSNLALASGKTAGAPGTKAVGIDVTNDEKRQSLISKADLVISLLPPSLHILVAKDCCKLRKHLLTASYISDEIRQLSKEINDNNLLFLCEMGLDPGIDHMSAMQIIHRLKSEQAEIHSFVSHCGGLVSPESDDNPWHYKISWNPSNVVKAGGDGARFLEKGELTFMTYDQLFENCKQVHIPSLGNYAYYPNRDSLSYIELYGLEDTGDFLRTTLRHPAFCMGWSALVKSGLTTETSITDLQPLTFREWAAPIVSFLNEENKIQLEYLGLFDQTLVPETLQTNAAILQSLLEKKLMLKKEDKDMVVMLHEFVYTVNGKRQRLTSSLVVKGEDHLHTAMAKTVGLPLGIAAKLILQQKIMLRGLHIPIQKEIYEPVLEELSNAGIAFTEHYE
jgi:saccharopine dehydrogenase-like NADP-dependent oxidoreductase